MQANSVGKKKCFVVYTIKITQEKWQEKYAAPYLFQYKK